MTDVPLSFEQAVQAVKTLPTRPGNLALLRLYALYKQGTSGDVTGTKPGLTDMTGRYKYDAWASLAGMPEAEAQRQYVQLVTDLGNAEE